MLAYLYIPTPDFEKYVYKTTISVVSRGGKWDDDACGVWKDNGYIPHTIPYKYAISPHYPRYHAHHNNDPPNIDPDSNRNGRLHTNADHRTTLDRYTDSRIHTLSNRYTIPRNKHPNSNRKGNDNPTCTASLSNNIAPNKISDLFAVYHHGR